MEILYYYEQEKFEKNKPLKNSCKLKLAGDDMFINYIAEYYVEYIRFGKMNSITYEHALSYNIKDGKFTVIYRILNKKENTHNLYKTLTKIKKNNFELLLDLTHSGFYSGEKRYNFWGVKYRRACVDILKIISDKLGHDLVLTNKDHIINPLYDMLVEHHLGVNNIKWHNNVYNDICQVYPQKKWLKLNDNKFLPAVLDSLGIKSKLLVGNLSTTDKKVNIRSLKFMCNLFGDNYVDYFKEFDWLTIASEPMRKSKNYTCEDEHEKRAITKALKTYSEVDSILNDGILTTISNIFLLKEFLKEKGLPLKLKCRTANDLLSLKDSWDLHRKHYKLGYKLKYSLPEDMILDIEAPITIGDKTFVPSLILSEDDFRLEGMKMKNCMARQFNVANLYIHMSLSLGSKRVNLQYRRGMLNQSKGKANTTTPKEFSAAIEVLSLKMGKYNEINPKKTMYDIISN
jgi:hypothetical protein